MTGPKQVAIATSVDWSTQMVTFTEQAVNGLVTINPPTVTVPFVLIMRLATEPMLQSMPPQIRQMQFVTPPVQQPEQQPESARGGRSLAFDADVKNRQH